MNDQDEMFEAATEEPIGEAKVEGEGRKTKPLDAAAGPNTFFAFCGLELHSFAIRGGSVKIIGRRERGDMPHEIYEITVDRADGLFPNRAKVLRDGKELFAIESQTNFNRCRKMAVSALHCLLKDQLRCNHKKGSAKNAESAKEMK